MTLLNDRDARIVKLNRVDGLSVRKIARELAIAPSTVCRTVQTFHRELAVFVGALDRHTPDTLRSFTIAALNNADIVRSQTQARTLAAA